jgi:predicted nucleic acid-binding Zn ribbon protein
MPGAADFRPRLDTTTCCAHPAAMPIHEYVALEPPGCALCCYGFERLERLADPVLTHCTACGRPVRRILGAAAVVSGQAHVLGEDHVAKHGFAKYRRIGKGHYEKVAGKGPDNIGGD